jgi:hypothetical protein
MNLDAIAAGIKIDAEILRAYAETGNAAKVARDLGLSPAYVQRRVGPKRRRDGKRYCCRCGILLQSEPHYAKCDACAWQWHEPCPAHCLQHRGMTDGVMCEECIVEIEKEGGVTA